MAQSNGAPTIHERLAEAGECPAFKFRYATTLVDHGTDLQFRVTGKVSWRKDANQVDIWEDVDITFTFKAYNCAQSLGTPKNGSGSTCSRFIMASEKTFSAVQTKLDPSHSLDPGSSSSAQNQSKSEILSKTELATVFVGLTHGNREWFADSLITALVTYISEVVDAVLKKPNLQLHSPAIPLHTLVFFVSCETLSGTSPWPSVAAYLIDFPNRAYVAL